MKVVQTDLEDDGFGEVVELFKAYCDKFRPLDSRPKDHVISLALNAHSSRRSSKWQVGGRHPCTN